MKKDKGAPAYLQVARDIAGRIASGEIGEGQRFSGRSLMSSKYNVSPETIRRALGLLSEMDVLDMKPGSGAQVKSRERAAQYLGQHDEAHGMQMLKERLNELIAQRRAIDEQMQETIRQLTDMAERFRYGDVMRTYEFAVPPGARIEGMSIADIGFRKQTGATILAIRRGGEVRLSPPPEEVIAAHDVLVVACGVLLVPIVSEFVNQVQDQGGE